MIQTLNVMGIVVYLKASQLRSRKYLYQVESPSHVMGQLNIQMPNKFYLNLPNKTIKES